MTTYGFECLTCGHRQADYAGRCPTCSGTMSACYDDPSARIPREPWEKSDRRQGRAQRFAPIAYHEDARGHLTMPGHESAKPRPGVERKEARTIREIEALERRFNAQEGVVAERVMQQEEIARTLVRSETRSRMRQRIQSSQTSARARSFAERWMAHQDQRPVERKTPNLHFDVLHFDQSNRVPYVDARTGWKTRRD